MVRRLGTAALSMAMMWALLACSAPAHWADDRLDIYAPPPARPGAEGVSIQWFGVSTLHITDGMSSIMIDGFFWRCHWQEAVVKPGARLVIPIHWDNFTRPYTVAYHPPPRLFDNVDGAMARLHAAGGATPHIRLAVLPPFVPARVLPLQR